VSVTAEQQSLEGKHQRLEPQNQGVHEPEGIHNVKTNTPRGAGVFGDNQLVVGGIGVGDAGLGTVFVKNLTWVKISGGSPGIKAAVSQRGG
jgi:hypothetical protein